MNIEKIKSDFEWKKPKDDEDDGPILRHGFHYFGSGPIPDTLLLELSDREWYRRVTTLTVFEYSGYKLAKLKTLIDHTVLPGLGSLTHDDSNKLNYRIRARDLTQREIDAVLAKEQA